MNKTDLQLFDGGSVGKIRALVQEGSPWFVATDVARALGYSNSSKAIADHVDPEDVTKRYILSNGGRQKTTLINESGMYALIFGSRLESARKFKRWVTSEVLPAIRATGSYRAEETFSALEERVRVLEASVRELRPAGMSDYQKVRIVRYNERAIVVLGDTRCLRERMRKLGGKWCPFLTVDGAPERGWVFTAMREEEITHELETLGVL